MEFLKKLWADGKVKAALISAATAVAIFTGQYFGLLPVGQ